jgi:hypothetical protein
MPFYEVPVLPLENESFLRIINVLNTVKCGFVSRKDVQEMLTQGGN